MRAAGISMRRLSMPYLMVGVGFSVLLFLLNEFWVPGADETARLGYPITLRAAMTPECSYAVPDLAIVAPITSSSQLERAYRRVFAQNPSAWVEAHVPGERYNFLIVDGRVESVVVMRS